VHGDSAAPYLAAPYPPKGATGVSVHTAVQVIVADDDTGVDSTTVGLIIDDDEVDPIIEPAGGDPPAYLVRWMSPGGFAYGSTVRVEVVAADFAGNWMRGGWSFQVVSEEDWQEQLPAMGPFDGEWMGFGAWGGEARFSWLESRLTDTYRLRFRSLFEGAEYLFDLDESLCSRAFGVVTFSVRMERAQWQALAAAGLWDWSVVGYDPVAGRVVGRYSEPQSFRFASPRCTELLRPRDLAIFAGESRPVFSWRVDNRAVGYLFGMARLGADGVPVEPYYVADLPLFVNELPVSAANWKDLPAGRYVWTCVAVHADGSQAEYMLRHFVKE